MKGPWSDLTPIPMYYSARAALYALVFGCALFLVVWHFRAPVLVPFHAVTLFILVAALAFLDAIKNRPWRDSAAAWIFLGGMMLAVANVTFNNEQYIRENLRFEPFVGVKILAMFIPLFAPPRKWVAWTVLAVLAIMPLVQYYSWSAEAQAELGIQEPWVTLVFVVFAEISYELRLYAAETFLRAKVLAEKHHLMESVAALLLGARHLMNTPLQTIEAVVSVLELKEPSLFARTEKSFSTIRRTTEILTFAERYLQWDDLVLPNDTDELEFQARQVHSAMGEAARKD